jgi:hypothetical protein
MTTPEYLQTLADRISADLGDRFEVSLTFRHHGAALWAAGSSVHAARCDQVETRLVDGPCIVAMETCEPVAVPDVARETRWSPWVTRAATEGFAGCLAGPTRVDAASTVAVNVYTVDPAPWPAQLGETAARWSRVVADAVTDRLARAAAGDHEPGSPAGLSDEDAVHLALGVTMHANDCSAETALALLDSAAGQRDVPLAEVARTVLSTLGPVEPPTR